MGAAGFWDDSERAAEVSGEHARASRRLEAFGALSGDVEDLDALAEMAAEEQSLQAEVDEQIASVEARLAALGGLVASAAAARRPDSTQTERDDNVRPMLPPAPRWGATETCTRKQHRNEHRQFIERRKAAFISPAQAGVSTPQI